MPDRTYIELFAGAGGLSHGIELAGYKPYMLFDNDPRCAETLRMNMPDACVIEEDVRNVDFSPYRAEGITLLAGGVPCQPWSVAGKSKGFEDERNLWPYFLNAVREVRPQVVLAENVKGIMRPGFDEYRSYLVAQLSNPTVLRPSHETWEHHHERLTRLLRRPNMFQLSDLYSVQILELDAVNYSVPQRRKRVFFVAYRKDVRHRPLHLGLGAFKPVLRDVISGLPEPSSPEASACYHDHVFHPGAREYPGHTPMTLDQPAKTLKAGVHDVPGGEGVVRLDDGSIRYLTVRECARIQTFPDTWRFAGPRGAQMRQIGNAVPCNLGFFVAQGIRNSMDFGGSIVPGAPRP